MNKHITDRSIQRACNDGWTMEDLMREFGIESKEEFIASMERIYPNPKVYRNVYNKLMRNAKHRERHGKKAEEHIACNTTESAEKIEVGEVSSHCATYESVAEYEIMEITEECQEEETQMEEVHVPTRDERLAEMQSEEVKLSDELVSLENQHKKLVQEHKSYKDELKVLYADLEELRRMAMLSKAKIEELSIKCKAVTESMGAVTQLMRGVKADLLDVREKINQLKLVMVCVYADGTIELENLECSVDDICPAAELASKVIPVIQNPVAVELEISAKEVYAIAKLQAILEYLTREKLAYEVVYDNKNMNIQLFMNYDQVA